MKKDLAAARQKIEATIELCKLSTVSTLLRHPPGEYMSLALLLTFNFWAVNELGGLRGAVVWVLPRGWWGKFSSPCPFYLLLVVTIRSAADVLMFTAPL